MALLNKGKKLRQWRSKGLADMEQVLYESGAHLSRDLAKVSPP